MLSKRGLGQLAVLHRRLRPEKGTGLKASIRRSTLLSPRFVSEMLSAAPTTAPR